MRGSNPQPLHTVNTEEELMVLEITRFGGRRTEKGGGGGKRGILAKNHHRHCAGAVIGRHQRQQRAAEDHGVLRVLLQTLHVLIDHRRVRCVRLERLRKSKSCAKKRVMVRDGVLAADEISKR